MLAALKARGVILNATLILTEQGWGMKEAALNGGYISWSDVSSRCNHMAEKTCTSGHKKMHFTKSERKAEFYLCGEHICTDLSQMSIDANGYESWTLVYKHRSKEAVGDTDQAITMARFVGQVLPDETFWKVPSS